MARKSKYNLVWMDLEMTGLDAEKEVIIEIATLVTDSELNILEEGPCIAIHQRDEILDKMDEWNTKHHNASGLVKRVRESLIDQEQAEKRTLEFIKKKKPDTNLSEYMTWYVMNNKRYFNINEVILPKNLSRKYRLTLDYFEDLNENKTEEIIQTLLEDKLPTPGSAKNRKNTAPERGKTTLLEVKNA